MFDLNKWENLSNEFLVAILMVGRLLDVDKGRSESFINLLKQKSQKIIIYVYPGFSTSSFEQLTSAVGLELEKQLTQNVGFVKNS